MITTLRPSQVITNTECKSSKSDLLKEFSARMDRHSRKHSVENFFDDLSAKKLNNSFQRGSR